MKNFLRKLFNFFLVCSMICSTWEMPSVVMAAEEKADYEVNLSDMTCGADEEEQKDVPVYTAADFDVFLEDYNNGALPDFYITEFLFDGISQVKKISRDDATGEVTSKVIETRALNVNTTGNIRFYGTATDTMIAVNTNDVTGEICLILDGVSLTSAKTTPAVMVYNKDVNYSDCKVTLQTAEGSENYITGGKLKKVSTMTEEQADTYTKISSIYGDTADAYYYVYTGEEVKNLLFAQETADNEKIAEGDPYHYYKYGGAIGSDITLYFTGDGYLEVASLGDEGIEGKGDLIFTGGCGEYRITSYDDGLNASTSGTDISIDVESMFVSVNSDAEEGDAIDSNGTIHIEGGTVFALSHPDSQDNGLDSDRGTYINGGTVVATGNMADTVSNDSGQNFINLVFKNKQDAGTLIGMTSADGVPVMGYLADRSFTNLIYSSTDLQETTYYVYCGGSISGEEINGLYTEINAYVPGTQQQWSGSSGFGGRPDGGQPGQEGMTPPDGQQPGQEGMTPPDGQQPGQEGMTPPDGQQPGQEGMTPPDGQQPGQGQAGNDSGEASIEFTLSATTHTFYNVTDYTPSQILSGDVNMDGTVTADDALAILQFAAKLQTPVKQQSQAADVDGSGSVDAADALLVLQKAAKLIDVFPV